MKIAYLGIKGLPARGGAERVVEAIVQRLARQHEITVYCSRRYATAESSVQNVHLVHLPGLAGKYTSMTSLDFLAAWHAVLYGDYDLIHLHNIEASFILPLLRLRYPVVSTAHGFAYWRAKWGWAARWLLRLADWPFVNLSSRVTSVSSKVAESLSARFHKEIDYIPNGVGVDFQPDLKGATELLAGIGLAPGNYLIFVAERIEFTKGAHLALQAVNQLPQEIPLLVVGDINQVPAYRATLQAMAGTRTQFYPLIQDPSLLLGLVASARCLVFPSLVEAMSMVLLEAASIGAPILASDIPENTIVLGEGIEYFKSGDAASLAERLAWVLENGPLMALKSKQTQELIHRLYSWDAIVARYDRVYRQVVDHA